MGWILYGKQIQKTNRYIELSNNLKKDKKLVNLFYSNNLNIIEGKELFKKLIIQIIDNICDTPQEKNISVAINLDNTFGISCIEILCKKFKTLNVVTNNNTVKSFFIFLTSIYIFFTSSCFYL